MSKKLWTTAWYSKSSSKFDEQQNTSPILQQPVLRVVKLFISQNCAILLHSSWRSEVEKKPMIRWKEAMG